MAPRSAASSPEGWPFTDAAARGLVAAARTARSLALCHCGDCLWYHGFWTWWRALGLASGADLHREFFRAAAGAAPAAARILVSGSGDSALLAVAADAAGGAATGTGIHVLDRCETPLHACSRFALETGLSVRTHACDIVDFDLEGGYDLILVHALLGFIEPRRRPRLFRRWHSLLAPGGRLLMVQRIRPGSGARAVRFRAAEARRFAERVALAAVDLADPGERAALERAARDYARHKRTWPVSGADELEALVRDGGLRVAGCRVSAGGTAAGGATGPTLRSGAPYAHLVAVRDP